MRSAECGEPGFHSALRTPHCRWLHFRYSLDVDRLSAVRPATNPAGPAHGSPPPVRPPRAGETRRRSPRRPARGTGRRTSTACTGAASSTACSRRNPAPSAKPPPWRSAKGLLEYSRTETRGRFEIRMGAPDREGGRVPLRARLAARRCWARCATCWPRPAVGHPDVAGRDAQVAGAARHRTSPKRWHRYLAKLDALSQRVEQALRRAEVPLDLSESLRDVVPWGVDALTYLDRRDGGRGGGRLSAAGAIRGGSRPSTRPSRSASFTTGSGGWPTTGQCNYPPGPDRERSRSRNMHSWLTGS